MRFFIPLILLFNFIHVSEIFSQNRMVTEWKKDKYRIVLAYIGEQQRWAEMSRQVPPFELPAIIRGIDRKNYVLAKDGRWMLERDFSSKINVSFKYIDSDSLIDVKDGQIIETEKEHMLMTFSMENGFDNVKLVSIRDQKATNQAYDSNPIFTQFPRNQAKTSINANIPSEGAKIFYTAELAMCENTFSIHIPSGEKLFEFTIVRKQPKHFFDLEDMISEEGIFVSDNQYPSGKRVIVGREVIANEIIYSFENPNDFDVEVQLGFGTEYNIKYPPALNNKQFGHPVSMDFGFKAARTDKIKIKANQKVENIRVYLDKCEYARNPFRLNVSSIRPIAASTPKN